MKEFVVIHDYLVAESIVGDWDGQEEQVAERMNEIYHTLNILQSNYKEIELKLQDSKSDNKLMSLLQLKKLKIKFPSFQRAIVNDRVDELYKSIALKPHFLVPLYIGKIQHDYYIIEYICLNNIAI